MRSFYPSAMAILVAVSMGTAAVAQQAGNTPPQQSQEKHAEQQSGAEPVQMPVTVKVNQPDGKKTAATDDDPVFGQPKLPDGKTSLIGGTVSKIDGIHNELGVKVFGGNRWNVQFDERTHFFRDGKETTFEHVKKGDRVYVDTMLDGDKILARNVRVVTSAVVADARGQITSIESNIASVADSLSGRPVTFRVNDDTQIKREGQTVPASELKPGALVSVQFKPGQAREGNAQEITILAAPGETFTFAGKVRYLDVSSGSIAVENRTDNKTYDIAFDRKRQLPSNLMVGSDVTVAAIFDGNHYKANDISVNQESK
ncbi:MAG TPA: DUF5666 domain-containing protein [Terriglobales bacterium]|nr:DUF5666 domain-containing protein [Terriglobales bacterium]